MVHNLVNTNIMEFITIASTGNAQDFGDLTDGKTWICILSSQTRGINAGGCLRFHVKC